MPSFDFRFAHHALREEFGLVRWGGPCSELGGQGIAPDVGSRCTCGPGGSACKTTGALREMNLALLYISAEASTVAMQRHTHYVLVLLTFSTSTA